MMTGVVLGIVYLVLKLFFPRENTDTDTIVWNRHACSIRGRIKPILVFFGSAAVVSLLLFLISVVVRGNIGDTRTGDRTVGSVAPGGEDVRSYVSTFGKEKGITFPILLDTCVDARSCVSSVYGAGNLPTTVVISPEGIVTRIKVGVVDSFWLRSAVDGD